MTDNVQRLDRFHAQVMLSWYRFVKNNLIHTSLVQSTILIQGNVQTNSLQVQEHKWLRRFSYIKAFFKLVMCAGHKLIVGVHIYQPCVKSFQISTIPSDGEGAMGHWCQTPKGCTSLPGTRNEEVIVTFPIYISIRIGTMCSLYCKL